MRDALSIAVIVAAWTACTPDWASSKDAALDVTQTDAEAAAKSEDNSAPAEQHPSEMKDAGEEPASDAGTEDGAVDAAESADCGDEHVLVEGNVCACPPGSEDNGGGCEDIDDCALNPCLNGGTCVDAGNGRTCHCGHQFMGDDCELEICGDLYLRSAADLLNNRLCGKVDGNLLIESGSGLASITADDLPYLIEVTGALNIFARVDASEGTLLRSATFAKLEVVGGPVSFAAVNGRGPAEELHFPALTSIGGKPVSASSSRDGLGLLESRSEELGHAQSHDHRGPPSPREPLTPAEG